jgi:hypothetical protein
MFCRPLATRVVLVGPLLIAGGCFSFSGRTVIEEKAETVGRISNLESRVGALEDAMSVRIVPDQPQTPPFDVPR